MFYSKTTNGFYETAIHGNKIPADAVEITAEEHAALLEAQSQGKVIKGNNKGKPVAVDPPALPPSAPSVVSMRQARLALLNAGLLQSVNDAVAGLKGAAGEAAKIEWEYASEVRRDNVLFQQLAVELGLTDQVLDDLFTAAASL